MTYQRAAAWLLDSLAHSSPAQSQSRHFVDALWADLAAAHGQTFPAGTELWPAYELEPGARPESLLAPLRSLEWFDQADVALSAIDPATDAQGLSDLATPFAMLGVVIELGTPGRIRVPHGALSGLRDAFIRWKASGELGARRMGDALASWQEQLVVFVVVHGPGYRVPELIALGPSRRGEGDAEARAKLDLRTIYVPLNDVAKQPRVAAPDFDNELMGKLGDLLRSNADDPHAWKAAFARDLKTLTEARNEFRRRLKKSLATLMRLLEETRAEAAPAGELLALRDAASILAYRTMFLLELERRGRLYREGAPPLLTGGKSSRQPLQEVFAYLHVAPTPGAALVRLVETSRSVRGDAPNDALLISGPSIFSNQPNDAFDPEVAEWLTAVDDLAQRAQASGGADAELLTRWDEALGATGSVMLGHLDDEFSAELNLIGGAASRHRHRVLGNVYEQILAMTPSRAKTGLVSLSATKKGKKVTSEKDERAALGAHYTPVTLVNEVVRPVFAARFARLWSAAGNERGAYLEGLEGLRVIDPAMGSAHFLTVAALELAREIAWSKMRKQPRFLELPNWGEPLSHRNPIGQDPEGEAEGAVEVYLDPEHAADFEQAVQRALPGVIQRSIFGVDINPLAVELAKLSLWLFEVVEHTEPGTGADYPELSFLDANLQCGDSVIGLDLDEVAEVLDAARPASETFELFATHHETLDDRLKQIRNLEAKLRREDEGDEGGIESYPRRRAIHEQIQSLVAELDWLFDLALFLTLQGYSAKAGAKATAAVAELLLGRTPKGTRAQQRAAVENALTPLLDAPFEHSTERQALVQRLRRFFRQQDPAHPLRPFHWPLRFTAARLAGGFDAIVANPPFIGDRNLRARIGDTHTEFLAQHYTRGKVSEYAGYFLHRFAQEVGAEGAIGTLSTNSIAQASNREYVLYPLLNGPWRKSERRLRLTRAVRSRVWPGDASVHYAMLHLEVKASSDREYSVLIEPHWRNPRPDSAESSPDVELALQPDSEEPVGYPEISSYLDIYVEYLAKTLPSYNKQLITQGFSLRGNFSIHRRPGEDIKSSVGRIPVAEREALAAYANGEDLQQTGVLEAKDVVVDFFGPLARAGLHRSSVAKQLEWIESRFPTLIWQLQNPSPHDPTSQILYVFRHGLKTTPDNTFNIQRWYLFHRPRMQLREELEKLHHAYTFPRVVKAWSPTPLPLQDSTTGLRICPSDATTLAATDSLSWFGVVQSFVFESLVRRQCSTLKSDLRFTPTFVFPFLPYPWPSHFDAEAGRLSSEPAPDAELSGSLAEVAALAGALLDQREAVLEHPAAHGIDRPGSQWGPTKLYNRYDDPAVEDAKLPAIAKLRRLHAELLQAVLRAYGWDDLADDAAREHWIFDRPWLDHSLRFVPPASVRDAIYARIAALNAQRFEEEIALLLPLAKPALPKRAASPKKLRAALAERNIQVSDSVASTLLERLLA